MHSVIVSESKRKEKVRRRKGKGGNETLKPALE
jgi:hypothetical protein